MIRQLMVLDKTGDMVKHITKVFTGFIRGYQVFHVTDTDEAIALAKKQMIDVVIVNGEASLSADAMKVLKDKIYPKPKIVLLLEPNLLDTLPGLEGKADCVINSSNFRSSKLRRTIIDLAHKKYMEEYEREKKEIVDQKHQAQIVEQEFDAICEELKQKYGDKPKDSEEEK